MVNPSRLKSAPTLRDDVLYILDQLVAAGSSAAYIMRDDFVTPEPSYSQGERRSHALPQANDTLARGGQPQ